VISGDQLARFRALLGTRLGWTFADNDLGQLREALAGRVVATGHSPAVYLTRLSRPDADADAELTALIERLSNTETYFFRHGEQFRALAEDVLPRRVTARSSQRVLTLLSVGCSSGEEAYSLAIQARAAAPDRDWIVSVLGVDANPAMLSKAITARFNGWALRETPDDVRERWFHPHDGEYELDPSIRASVQFRQHNVVEDDPALWRPGRYDVIFCRNLLMYLTPDTVDRLVRRMTNALAPGGYLFLGHTDSLGPRPESLESLQTHHVFYYRRPETSEPEPPARTRRAVPQPSHHPDLYERALTLVRDERFAAALDVVETGLGDRPQPRDLLLHGVLLAQAGRLADAEIECRRLLDIDGLYADAHHLLGVCLEGGAAVDVAIGHYRLAAHLDPDFAMPRLRLGLLARRRGDQRAATDELGRALPLLRDEREERVVLFGGGFGRIALTALCRAERDACGVRG
jgi:chemotaxis protein methyltransferase CheR